jgi:hypothetical protein
LQARLITDADAGSVLPPARLNELLRRWVQAADPAEAARRRRRAEAGRSVDYRLRPDGLGDLFCTGFRAPDLHAILSRIAARSVPWGAQDDRTADQRRFDAVRDLLLGRDTHPPDDPQPQPQPQPGAAGCGCRAGQPAPCGAELVVHVPLGAALGVTDEVAELAGPAGTGRWRRTCSPTCCWPPHGYGRCGSDRTAPRSPSATGPSDPNATTRSPSGTRCSTWRRCHRLSRRPATPTTTGRRREPPETPGRTRPTRPGPTGHRAGYAG